MSTLHHELHPADATAMQSMRAAMGHAPKPVLGPDARPGFDAMIATAPAPEDVVFEAGSVGGVPGWWCRPSGAPQGAAILYLHGGAFVLGSATAYRNFAGQIARSAGAICFVAEYALAPERPFPAAMADAQAAFEGLAALGVHRVVVAGDSAGGGLALALALQNARRAAKAVGVVAISPWTDLSLSGESMVTRAEMDPLLSRAALSDAARLYLDGADPHDPRASALHGDFTDVPPVSLHVGDAEVLLDDTLRFGTSVEAAGGACEVHVWDGMVHVFPSQLAALRAARECMRDIGTFLRDCLIAGDRL